MCFISRGVGHVDAREASRLTDDLKQTPFITGAMRQRHTHTHTSTTSVGAMGTEAHLHTEHGGAFWNQKWFYRLLYNQSSPLVVRREIAALTHEA